MALMKAPRDKVISMLAQLQVPFSSQDAHSHLVVRLLRVVARLPPHVLDLPSFYPLKLKRYSFRKVVADDGGAIKVTADSSGECKQQ